MSKTIKKAFSFPSNSSPGKSYQVLLWDDGTVTCDCKIWTFKRQLDAAGRRTCRHCRDVLAGMAAEIPMTTTRTGTAAPVQPQESRGRRFQLESE